MNMRCLLEPVYIFVAFHLYILNINALFMIHFFLLFALSLALSFLSMAHFSSLFISFHLHIIISKANQNVLKSCAFFFSIFFCYFTISSYTFILILYGFLHVHFYFLLRINYYVVKWKPVGDWVGLG